MSCIWGIIIQFDLILSVKSFATCDRTEAPLVTAFPEMRRPLRTLPVARRVGERSIWMGINAETGYFKLHSALSDSRGFDFFEFLRDELFQFP